jgi:type IV pilus assembly protein PilQ
MTAERIKISLAFLALIMVLSFSSSSHVPFGTAAFAAARRDIPPGLTLTEPTYPVLAGIQAQQMGDSSLQIGIRGFNLPLPRAASAPGEARLVLQWDGARFPQTGDKNDWWAGYDWDVITIHGRETNSWWKQYDLPLLNRIIAEPVDEDSLRLTFVTTKPVAIENITGIAGADELLIILEELEPEKAPEPPARPKAYEKGDPMAINAPVTLQLRDAEIKSVFRMLADMQKLNLLLDPSVPDMAVTFSFNAVPYSEAFAYMLRMADLSYSVTKGMLVVGRPESLGRTLGTEYTKSYRMSYAIDDSGALRSDLTATLTGLISLSKPPVLDPRTRELYVTATDEQHREISDILERLDHPGRQVMLEARLFSVNDDATQDLEAVISAIYDQWLATFSGGRLNAGYFSGKNYETSGGLELDGDVMPVAPPGFGTLEGAILNTGQEVLSAGLTALETKGKGKTIANPSVITIDGQEANVAITQTVTYVSGSTPNGDNEYSSRSVGPQMTFLPVIGRDGVITIKISLQTGSIDGFTGTVATGIVPQTSEREVTTTVRVRDGEPFVVGGLFQDVKSSSKNRVPVLGYLPLLGNLFTTTSESHRKTEIAMIVIPHILNVPNSDVPSSVLKKTSALP